MRSLKMEHQDIWDNNQANKKEYCAHEVFMRLKKFSDFYDQLSFSVPDTPTMGIEFITNMDTFVYSSIHGTLESISLVLKNGRIGDAFALLRKYHDSVIINIYTNLYLEDNRNIENLVIVEISNWLKGVKPLPDYRRMSQYVRNSERLKPITDVLYSDDRYKKTRDRCNDNLHYNFFSNVEANDNQIHFINRENLLSLFKEDVTNIVVLHLSYLFFLHDH